MKQDDFSRLYQTQPECESGFVCEVCCVDGRYSPTLGFADLL